MQEDVNVNLLQEGDFVAIKLANYRKHPIIGKALEVNDDGFVICYWKGSYNKEWAPHTLPARRGSSGNNLWTQQLPKSCIICFGFSLDENSKLLPGTKKRIQARQPFGNGGRMTDTKLDSCYNYVVPSYTCQ